MGAGKTTVGRIVAKRLNLPFKDTDEIIEDIEMMSIYEIFETKGENYFRELEEKIILSTSYDSEKVMAVGGGGFNEKTIPKLKSLGPTIYLDLSFEEAKRRIEMGRKKRPLLKDKNLFGLFIKRRSLYLKAHFRIWTESLTVDEVVESVLRIV